MLLDTREQLGADGPFRRRCGRRQNVSVGAQNGMFDHFFAISEAPGEEPRVTSSQVIEVCGRLFVALSSTAHQVRQVIREVRHPRPPLCMPGWTVARSDISRQAHARRSDLTRHQFIVGEARGLRTTLPLERNHRRVPARPTGCQATWPLRSFDLGRRKRWARPQWRHTIGTLGGGGGGGDQ